MQFILAMEAAPDDSCELGGRDYHYLVNVRRVKIGDEIAGVLPSGETARLTVIDIDRKLRLCKLQSEQHEERCRTPDDCQPSRCRTPADYRLPSVKIVLFQALPKGAGMDLIVRQAAECGVSEIVPFVAERSVRRGAQSGSLERWRRIIREARQQSGSATATVIHPVREEEEAVSFWEQLKESRPALGLFFHPRPSENCTPRLHGYLADNSIETIAFVIGAEGGFSLREREKFLACGFKSVLMGETVLRVETASLYALSSIRTILLERDSWILSAKE